MNESQTATAIRFIEVAISRLGLRSYLIDWQRLDGASLLEVFRLLVDMQAEQKDMLRRSRLPHPPASEGKMIREDDETFFVMGPGA